jgi:nitrogen fixation NifU-like protein
MYSEKFLFHFRNPLNAGELPPPALTVEVVNPACGDILRLSVLFEGERVSEARYKARGCAASIASGSALTQWLRGKTREELALLRPEMVEELVGGLSPESRHAAALCVDGVVAVLARGR